MCGEGGVVYLVSGLGGSRGFSVPSVFTRGRRVPSLWTRGITRGIACTLFVD